MADMYGNDNYEDDEVLLDDDGGDLVASPREYAAAVTVCICIVGFLALLAGCWLAGRLW